MISGGCADTLEQAVTVAPEGASSAYAVTIVTVDANDAKSSRNVSEEIAMLVRPQAQLDSCTRLGIGRALPPHLRDYAAIVQM